MRLTRSMGFKFSLQQYESCDIMASATVSSADLGFTDEQLAEMDDTQLDQHADDLEAYCAEMLQRQLAPLLSEADDLTEKMSAAHDVAKYHEGQREAAANGTGR